MAEGPTGQGSLPENRMVLGRGQGIGGWGGDEEKVMTVGPPWPGISWAGDVQFMVRSLAVCSPLRVSKE